MTRSKFDIAYNEWLRQVDSEGEDAVWNDIQDELDSIETWDKISAKLDVVKPIKEYGVASKKYLQVLAVIVAILIVMLPVKYINEREIYLTTTIEQSNKANVKEEKNSDKPILSKSSKEDVEIIQKIVAETPPTNNSKQKSIASFSLNEFMPIIESNDSSSSTFSMKEPVTHMIQALPFDFNILYDSSYMMPKNLLEASRNFISEPAEPTSVSKKSSRLFLRVVDVGLVYGHKNTWLLNHETLNGLDPKKLGNTLPTFHQDIGVSSSFEVNNRHLIGLEFLWKSGAGQNYQQYINASFVEKNISLDYLKLQAFYIWQNDRLPGEAIMGGYFAGLTMAEEQQDITRLGVNDSYSDLDYGLLAGYQFNIALHNRIILKPSIRASYNLVNIFEGDDITPSHFKKTKNLAASLNFSLSYRFFK